MSAVLSAPFGTPECIHRAACANDVYIRAMSLNYSETVARALAHSAKARAWLYRSPAECALAEVPRRTQSATLRGHTPPERAA